MMNNELRPYEGYKPTNLPWLDEIPLHWSLSRNKNVMIQNKTLVGLNHTQYKLLSLTLNGVIARDMVNPKGKFPKEFDTYQVVNEKNLVFCLFDIDETPRTVGISPIDGMITGAYTVLKVVNANEKFLYYYYLSIDNNKMLKPLYTGLRKVISADTFLRTKLPVPPRPEQDQIVKYLDHQLFKINKFIKAKKKLIAVLKEQKRVKIHEVVTQGLNKNVKLKQSGIEWLGEVPEHWDVRRIKTFSIVKRGASPRPIDDAKYFDENGKYAWVRISDVTNSTRYLEQTEQKLSELGSSLSVKIKPGDLIVSICASVGKPCISKIDCCIHDGFITLKKLSEHLVQFIFSIFSSKLPFVGLGNVGTQLNLNSSIIGNISIALPPMEELDCINSIVFDIESDFEKLISRVEKEIDLITEYKNSLISDVVTGKIDVREIIIDETEEIDLKDLELDEDSADAEEIIEDEEGDE